MELEENVPWMDLLAATFLTPASHVQAGEWSWDIEMRRKSGVSRAKLTGLHQSHETVFEIVIFIPARAIMLRPKTLPAYVFGSDHPVSESAVFLARICSKAVQVIHINPRP